MDKTRLKLNVVKGNIFISVYNFSESYTTEQATENHSIYRNCSVSVPVLENVYVDSLGNIDNNGIEKRHTKTTVYEHCSNIPVSIRYRNNDLSDSFVANWFYHIIPYMVYNLLKLMYSKSSDKMTFQLMIDCLNYIKTENTKSEYEMYLADLKETEKVTKSKISTYTIVTFPDGTKHRKELLPVETTELTAFGKELFSESEKREREQRPFYTDIQDLIQIGVTTAYELLNIGLINSFNSIWDCQGYIQSVIRSFIYEQKRLETAIDDTRELMTFFDNDNDNVYIGRNVENKLNKIELQEIEQAISDLFETELKKQKKVDVEKVLTAFKKYFFENENTKYISKELNLDVRTIQRYLVKFRSIVENNSVFNQLIHDIIKERIM